jgi:hypothetical protein
MATAYPFGPIYFQKLHMKRGSSIFEVAPTHEQVAPYRIGRCLIVKYWPDRALAVGWWIGKHGSEDSALMAGMQGREDELVDDNGKILDRYKTRQDARAVIAKNSADLDEEWEVLNVLDLIEDAKDSYECDDAEDDDDDHLGSEGDYEGIEFFEIDEEDR